MTMRSRILAAAAVALAAPFATRAGPGAEIGLRTGFALPFGDLAANVPLSSSFNGFVPLGVELGVRYTPALSMLVSFGYSFGLTTNCPAGDSCSGHQINLGLDLRYHARPHQTVDPWIGLGAGFEWLGASESGSFNGDLTFNGFEYVHVQLGADLAASEKVRVGPFFELGLGQYRSLKASAGGASGSADILDKAVHEFLTFGLRVSFLL